MLWGDEIAPLVPEQLIDHVLRDKIIKLEPSIGSLVFHGPEGSGRHSAARVLVRKWIGSEVFDRSVVMDHTFLTETKKGFITLSGVPVKAETKEFTFTMIKSPMHIEIRPSVAGHYDHYLIKEALNFAKFGHSADLDSCDKFFIIVSAAEELSSRAKDALRVQLEKVSEFASFIFVTSQPSKLGRPILSRCTHIRVPAKHPDAIQEILTKVIVSKKMILPSDAVLKRLCVPGTSLRRALLLAQTISVSGTDWDMYEDTDVPLPRSKLDNEIHCIMTDLISLSKKTIGEIQIVESLKKLCQRTTHLLTRNVSGSEIITTFMRMLWNTNIVKHSGYAFAEVAAMYESRLSIRAGGWDAYCHLCGFIAEIYECLCSEFYSIHSSRQKACVSSAPALSLEFISDSEMIEEMD